MNSLLWIALKNNVSRSIYIYVMNSYITDLSIRYGLTFVNFILGIYKDYILCTLINHYKRINYEDNLFLFKLFK